MGDQPQDARQALGQEIQTLGRKKEEKILGKRPPLVRGIKLLQFETDKDGLLKFRCCAGAVEVLK